MRAGHPGAATPGGAVPLFAQRAGSTILCALSARDSAQKGRAEFKGQLKISG